MSRNWKDKKCKKNQKKRARFEKLRLQHLLRPRSTTYVQHAKWRMGDYL